MVFSFTPRYTFCYFEESGQRKIWDDCNWNTYLSGCSIIIAIWNENFAAGYYWFIGVVQQCNPTT